MREALLSIRPDWKSGLFKYRVVSLALQQNPLFMEWMCDKRDEKRYDKITNEENTAWLKMAEAKLKIN